MLKRLQVQIKTAKEIFFSNEKKFSFEEFEVLVDFIVNRPGMAQKSNTFLNFILDNQMEIKKEIVNNTKLKRKDMQFLYLSEDPVNIKKMFHSREQWLLLDSNLETIEYLNYLKTFRHLDKTTRDKYRKRGLQYFSQIVLWSLIGTYLFHELYSSFILDNSFADQMAPDPLITKFLETTYTFPVIFIVLFTLIIGWYWLWILYNFYVTKENKLAKQLTLLRYKKQVYFILLKNYLPQDDLIGYIPFDREMKESTREFFSYGHLLRDEFLELDRFFGNWQTEKIKTNNLALNSYLQNTSKSVNSTQNLRPRDMIHVLKQEKEKFRMQLNSYNYRPTFDALEVLTEMTLLIVTASLMVMSTVIVISLMPSTAM